MFRSLSRMRTLISYAWICLLSLSLAAPALGAAKEAPRKSSEAHALTGKSARVESGQKFFGDGKFAGSESCKECHEKQYDDWAKSRRLAIVVAVCRRVAAWPASSVIRSSSSASVKTGGKRSNTSDAFSLLS